MIKIDKAIFKRSDVVGKKPTAEQLDYGEIAINYAKNSEAIFFKNNENHIVEIKAQDKLIEVTYSQLKALRDGKKLVPGQLYRITDFVTTSTPTEGQPLKNFTVKSGVMGTDSAKLAIVIDTANFPLNSNYEWTIAKNSKGEIKQYCEADLIN